MSSIARVVCRASFWGAVCFGAADFLLHGMISDWMRVEFPTLAPLLDIQIASATLGGLIHAILREIDIGLWAFALWPLVICKFSVMGGLAAEAAWFAFAMWAGSGKAKEEGPSAVSTNAPPVVGPPS